MMVQGFYSVGTQVGNATEGNTPPSQITPNATQFVVLHARVRVERPGVGRIRIRPGTLPTTWYTGYKGPHE